MNHRAKVEVANKLADQLKRTYGRDILAVLLDGSVAREDDTEYSDLELRVVTRKTLRMKGMSGTGYREFVYRDLAILIQFMEDKEVRQLIGRPSVEWPIKVWPFLEPRLLLPSPEAEMEVMGFRECYEALNPESFRPAVQWSLVWCWGMYNKARNKIKANSRDVVWVAPSLAHTAALSVALVNGRYLHYGDSRYLAEIKSFAHLPARFIVLFGQLQNSDHEVIGRAAKAMWESCRTFAEARGYPMKADKTWSGLLRTIDLEPRIKRG